MSKINFYEYEKIEFVIEKQEKKLRLLRNRSIWKVKWFWWVKQTNQQNLHLAIF